ncbi:hypothetical protein [Peribacillus simplex]|uniref:hypothetical protein n=1 Tax=Peribacillus simplex TaxID=1478 RepID=UPI003670D780
MGAVHKGKEYFLLEGIRNLVLFLGAEESSFILLFLFSTNCALGEEEVKRDFQLDDPFLHADNI